MLALRLATEDAAAMRGGGAASVPIVNRTNTTVTGAGPYTITKSGGVAATFDADAVSLIGFTGDFLLTLSTSNAALAGVAGMNSDPATDANYTSIDRALSFGGDGNIRAFENGSLLTLYGAYSIANT
jgi:hypothetical protein